MQPLTAEQAIFLLQNSYLPALKNEHRMTKKVIEAVPADKGDYRPEPNSRTALELAWHIAAAEVRFLETVIHGEFPASGAARPDSVKSSRDVAAWYADGFNKNFETLTKVPSEKLLKIVDFRGLFQLPAVTFLQIAMSHSIHHRGQLSVYLRPMGAKVPSIYGESYDDAQTRKAASQA